MNNDYEITLTVKKIMNEEEFKELFKAILADDD